LHRLCLILVCFLVITNADAQQNRVDTLRAQLYRDSLRIYRFRKLLPLLSFDQRNTFLETRADDNTPVNVRGVKFGATIMERHRTGFGLYQVMQKRKHLNKVNGLPANVHFEFRYLTIFYEYYFVYTKRWDVGIPFEVGAGRYRASDTFFARNGLVWPMGTGIDVHLKLHRWLALTTMGGYRFVGHNNSGVKLDNWFYSFGVAISTRHMLEDTRYYLKKRKFNREVRDWELWRKNKK